MHGPEQFAINLLIEQQGADHLMPLPVEPALVAKLDRNNIQRVQTGHLA